MVWLPAPLVGEIHLIAPARGEETDLVIRTLAFRIADDVTRLAEAHPRSPHCATKQLSRDASTRAAVAPGELADPAVSVRRRARMTDRFLLLSRTLLGFAGAATALLLGRAALAQPAPAVAAAPGQAAATDEEAADAEVIIVESEAPAASASSVYFGEQELRRRPHSQPSDLLRQAPGLMVSQHAGGGKSDQYFLRGFDADHGTDVALFVDGVPVNLTSHGHGQGYADSHWLIPELVTSLAVHKGPYAARFGDHATAGAIELTTADSVPAAGVWLSGGTELAGPVALQRPTMRMVGIASPKLGDGRALVAAEVSRSDGPFVNPQDFDRLTSMAKWMHPLAGGQLTLSGTFYTATWNQSGQLPAQEIAAGRLDRFGSLDASEGGSSHRASLAATWERGEPATGAWSAQAYLVDYQLQLFSNFTLFARDLERGDQIEQGDDRTFGGGALTYRRAHGGPLPGLLRVGLQLRGDATRTSLWHTERRARLDGCFESANPCNLTDNRIGQVAAYVEEDIAVGDRVRVLAGLRADQFWWGVTDRASPMAGAGDPMQVDDAGGQANRALLSPKLSVIGRASDAIEVFVNTGFGYHSNDARSAVANDGDGALARAFGAEVGLRLAVGSSIRASAAAWYLHLSSEQVWSGDAGGTEPSDPTQRYGADVDLSWRASPWLSLDANVAVARAELVANAGNGGALALAPRLMGGAGVTVEHRGNFAALRMRGVDARPANEDGSLTAEGFALLDVVAERKVGRTSLGLSITNLLNSKWREAQFAEVSRVSPASAALEDVHFTPGAPLTAMLTIGRTL
jgi:outer membrane receptor protein involved in Fe transport